MRWTVILLPLVLGQALPASAAPGTRRLSTSGKPYADGFTEWTAGLLSKPAHTTNKRLVAKAMTPGARFVFTDAITGYLGTKDAASVTVPAGAKIEVLRSPARSEQLGNVVAYQVHGAPGLEGRTLYSHWMFARDRLAPDAGAAPQVRGAAPEARVAAPVRAGTVLITAPPAPHGKLGTDELRELIPGWLDDRAVAALRGSGRAGTLDEAAIRRASSWKRGARTRDGDTIRREFSLGDAKAAPALRVVTNLDSTKVLSVELGAL